jgi:hypothetical protein
MAQDKVLISDDLEIQLSSLPVEPQRLFLVDALRDIFDAALDGRFGLDECIPELAKIGEKLIQVPNPRS